MKPRPRSIGELEPHRKALASFAVACALASALVLSACPRDDALQATITQLNSSDAREAAIEQLLLAVRKARPARKEAITTRVIHALSEAYRDDTHRAKIVDALAAINDARGAEVLISAMLAADRGEEYYPAAIRATRSLGTLKLKSAVAPLLVGLAKWQQEGRSRAQPAYELALLESLGAIGDGRAAPALLSTLSRPLDRSTYEISRAAIAALGTLRAQSAIPTLIAALHSQRSGTQLAEVARAALCQIGPSTVPALRETARSPKVPKKLREKALLLLGDLGVVLKASDLADDASAEERIAWARTTLQRKPTRRALQRLLTISRRSELALSTRIAAIEALGIYGDPTTAAALTADLLQTPTASATLRAATTLAVFRSAEAQNQAQVKLLSANANTVAGRHRKRWQVSLRCGKKPACFAALISNTDWRSAERAALALSRLGHRPVTVALAKRLATGNSHPQVEGAIVVALERLTPDAAKFKAQVARTLDQALQSKIRPKNHSVDSRIRCLSARLAGWPK